MATPSIIDTAQVIHQPSICHAWNNTTTQIKFQLDKSLPPLERSATKDKDK
jgi:hypothetical protein